MRKLTTLLLLLAVAGCAAGPRYQARPVSNEAANLFARAEAPGPGFSLVIDIETLRELGFLSAPPAEGEAPSTTLADAWVATLPVLIAAADDPTKKTQLARHAVIARLIQRWSVWPPHMQRLGLLLPTATLDKQALFDNGVLLFAVGADEATNKAVLEGFAALDRTYRSAQGATPRIPKMHLEQGQLCIEAEMVPVPLCLHGGGGYYAMGTAKALEAALASATVPAPAVDPALPPDVLRLRYDYPELGKVSVRLSGRDALKLEARLESTEPQLLAKLEEVLNKMVAQGDQSRAEARSLVVAELDLAKTSLAADAAAPAALKATAQALTADLVLDPEGNTEALRQSAKITRGANDLQAELTFPAPLIKATAEWLNGLATISAIGRIAGIAVPNFIKYQCRSKQSEARVNLLGLASAQMVFREERSAWSSSFEELGFTPYEGTRYTYCMAGQCLPCTREGCQVEGPNPCAIYEAGQNDFIACAFANLRGESDTLDVWLINSSIAPEHVSNDCAG
ncbi:MAG: hypothetical protein ACOX6T_00760 [Myxococcales bacterium]